MDKRREDEIKQYVVEVLDSLRGKIRSRDRDVLGKYGEEELTVEEEIVYEYYVKDANYEEATFIQNKYIDDLGLTNKQLWREMGVSENTFYKIRTELLLKLNGLMEKLYFGYGNRPQNLSELPYRLNLGTYTRYKDIFNFESLDGEIYGIKVGEYEVEYIDKMRVVSDNSFILSMVNAKEIGVDNNSVVVCYVTDDGFGDIGVIASIKLGGYSYLGDVLEDIQTSVRAYEEENGLNILKNDLVLDFKI